MSQLFRFVMEKSSILRLHDLTHSVRMVDFVFLFSPLIHLYEYIVWPMIERKTKKKEKMIVNWCVGLIIIIIDSSTEVAILWIYKTCLSMITPTEKREER